MDANGTGFHLLLGRDDWRACTGDAGRRCGRPERRSDRWLGDGATLTLRQRPFKFPRRRGRPRRRASPTGAAPGADRFGNWYWIDGPRQRDLRPVGRRRRDADSGRRGTGRRRRARDRAGRLRPGGSPRCPVRSRSPASP